MRRWASAGFAALFAATPALAQELIPFQQISTSTPPAVGNSLVISDASGAGETNYPYQFGRPFKDGDIPNSPSLLVNGAAVPTQADVKNRYPDGSVEFAVIAAVVPSIPANGSVTLTFANNTAPNNTPLTQAQMLDASYNFDAAVSLAGTAPGTPAVPAMGGTLTFTPPVANQNVAAWNAITNGGMIITVNGVVCTLTGMNFTALPTAQIGPTIAAAISQQAGQTVTWTAPGPAWEGLLTVVSGAISYATPPASGFDMATFFGLTSSEGGVITPPTAGSPATGGGPVTASASARQMLTDGSYTVWTAGPVAQTIILADDSTTAKYDVGFDGFKPLRPRFYATFWPATHQVTVRAVMDSGLMNAYEDTRYLATVTGGETSPTVETFGNLKETSLDLTTNLPQPHSTGLTIAQAEPAGYVGPVAISGTPSVAVQGYPTHYHALIDGVIEDITSVTPGAGGSLYLYSGGPAVAVGDAVTIGLGGPPKQHWAGSSWTNHFWLGGTPQQQVNIDPSLAYLESTHYLPNYDTATVVDPTSVPNEWAGFQAVNDGPYDGDLNGQGLWHSYGGDPGARPDIGPANGYTARWLTSSDWRARTVAFQQADIAASWPEMLIETDPARKLNRGDAAGTGLGRPASIIGRPNLLTWSGDLAQSGSDGPTVVGGGYDVTSDLNGNQWLIEGSHVPQRFSEQYYLSGDPWYLRELEFAASYEAARYNPQEPTNGAGRGPDGTYGLVSDEPRGWGWVMRDRVEAEVAEPDGTALKTYYNTLTNDALAYDDGAIGATGTPYDGSVMYAFGAAHGLPWGGTNHPLGMMQVEGCGPPAPGTECPTNVATTNIQWNPITTDGSTYIAGSGDALEDPWMQFYTTWGAGRVAELGYPGARPFQLWLGQMLTGMINTSGNPHLISAYEIPSASTNGDYPDWGAFWGTDAAPWNYPALQPAFATAANGPTEGLLGYFNGNLWSQGRPAYAQAAAALLVDAGAPGAASAWSWIAANVIPQITANTTVGGSSVFGGTLTYGLDPSWDLVPRTDTTVMPSQPTILE